MTFGMCSIRDQGENSAKNCQRIPIMSKNEAHPKSARPGAGAVVKITVQTLVKRTRFKTSKIPSYHCWCRRRESRQLPGCWLLAVGNPWH